MLKKTIKDVYKRSRKEQSGYAKEQVDDWDNKTKIKQGKKYIKIVQDTGVFCFIAKEDFKHFKKGDILKSWLQCACFKC